MPWPHYGVNQARIYEHRVGMSLFEGCLIVLLMPTETAKIVSMTRKNWSPSLLGLSSRPAQPDTSTVVLVMNPSRIEHIISMWICYKKLLSRENIAFASGI